MKISIIHPSRGRTEQAYNAFRTWTEKATDLGNIEYYMSVDIDEGHKYAARFSNFMHAINICANNNRSAIDAINNAAELCTGDLIVVISDDFDCFDGWDMELRKSVLGKSNFCAKTNDGLQKTLITLPIMDRFYYKSFGYVYHPDYAHMFCDQEMTAVAIMTGRYLQLPLTFPHNHYTTGKFNRDAISIRNDNTWAQGDALFNERMESNFGIESPVCKYDEIVWK